jgi:SAM-dependent methyltransferase
VADTVAAPGLALGAVAHFRWRCPLCAGPVSVSASAGQCDVAEHTFRQVGGIWCFLPEARRQTYAQFEQQYETVRAAEGWGKPDRQYFLALPEVAAVDPQTAIWRQRAGSFRALIEQVLQPLERERRRPLTVLDLGAGNCWLAHRLAGRGHRVAAVDVRTGELDGLGAHAWYGNADGSGEAAFTPVQAEFDRLPFAGDQADLVIFNASLHYAVDYTITLQETLRVLRQAGRVVVMDSPLYRQQGAGAAMVREREARYERVYSFRSNLLPSEHFLTERRLRTLAAALGLRWQAITPLPPWRYAVRDWKARVRGRREPARFPLIVGERMPNSRSSQAGMDPGAQPGLAYRRTETGDP